MLLSGRAARRLGGMLRNTPRNLPPPSFLSVLHLALFFFFNLDLQLLLHAKAAKSNAPPCSNGKHSARHRHVPGSAQAGMAWANTGCCMELPSCIRSPGGHASQASPYKSRGAMLPFTLFPFLGNAQSMHKVVDGLWLPAKSLAATFSAPGA